MDQLELALQLKDQAKPMVLVQLELVLLMMVLPLLTEVLPPDSMLLEKVQANFMLLDHQVSTQLLELTDQLELMLALESVDQLESTEDDDDKI